MISMGMPLPTTDPLARSLRGFCPGVVPQEGNDCLLQVAFHHDLELKLGGVDAPC